MAIVDTRSGFYATGQSLRSLSERRDFDLAIRLHLQVLYRYCLLRTHVPADAEDLLQTALVHAWERRCDFDGRGSVLGWFLSIARTVHLEQVRRSARRRSLISTLAGAAWTGIERIFSPTADDVERMIDGHVDGAMVKRALEQLPDADKDVVFLCDFEELSHDEVAHILGIAVGTVKSRHHRALRHLADAIPKEQARR
jgi:RNA polymerase sigma factor (sigma-70 family)